VLKHGTTYITAIIIIKDDKNTVTSRTAYCDTLTR